MEVNIPVLSLLVAAAAVIVGPVVSWWIAKRQIGSSLVVSNKQIIAPMRQVWINNLRDMIAELTSRSFHYFVSGFEDRTDAEYQQLEFLEHKIRLMLNPKESDHIELENRIRVMIAAIHAGKEKSDQFADLHPEVIALSRKILKREWDVVKQDIPLP